MIRELDAARVEILGKLADLQDRYIRGDYNTETFQRKQAFLLHQRNEVEDTLDSVFSNIGDQLQSASEDVIAATTVHTISTMNNSTGLDIQFFHLDPELVQAWFQTGLIEGSTLTDWLNKLKQSTADRIIKAQRQSLIQGESVGGMVKRLRQEGVEGSYRDLTGLARTSMLSAANYAREQTVTQGFGDVLTGWQYCATLDSRTCLVCGDLDGTTYGPTDQKEDLPLHWCCRCCYIPLVGGEGANTDDRPAVTDERVERFDGTYNEWMQSQLESDPGFVKDVLGPGRFDLFKDGKISLSNMVTNGEITTLADLKG